MSNQALAETALRPVPVLKTNFPVQNIFDSLLEVVCAINVDGLFEYVSRAAVDVWGYHADELIGLPHTDFLSKRDRKKTVFTIERLQRGEDIIFFENSFLHRSGTSIPLLWTARWDARDKMVYCVARDRTKIQEMETLNLSYAAEIQRQGRETINILERIRDGFFALDKTGNVTYWNGEAEKITGKTRDQVLGKSIWSSFAEKDGGRFEQACKTAADERAAFQYEAHYRSLDAWFEISIFPSDSGVSIFFKDISERKRLHDEMQKLSLIARETANAVTITDAGGCITWVNEAFTAVSGYSLQEALGHKPCVLLGGPGTDPATLEYILGQVSKAEPFRAEILGYNKKREEYWTEISGQPIFNEAGVLQQYFSIELDITEKRKMQARLQAETETRQKRITAAVLQAQEKERAAIGRDLHDNISQVLTTVQLYNESCLQGGAEKEELLLQSISLLKGAIEEIRGISKMLSAPSIGNSRLFDSITGLVGCVRLTNRVRISLDAPGLEEVTVSECLHIAVYRIVQEHLNNILKHAKADAVEITIRRTSKSLSVWIADDGVGFEVQGQRAGIGINNMMSRAESLNGSLRIISSSGNGCNLLVTFPLT